MIKAVLFTVCLQKALNRTNGQKKLKKDHDKLTECEENICQLVKIKDGRGEVGGGVVKCLHNVEKF